MNHESGSRRSKLDPDEYYVSRSAYKLESVVDKLEIKFRDKTVLDVGSSTGGFSDYALKHGAAKVIAVEKGTNQLNPKLKLNPRIELHEKTDINNFMPVDSVDIVLIDVSFTSLKVVLPSIYKWADRTTNIIAMAKPQFEAEDNRLKHNGIIKNERYRRDVFLSLETWFKKCFVIVVMPPIDWFSLGKVISFINIKVIMQ